MYVVRINGNDELLDSKPCNECLNAMKYMGINRVYYSLSNGDIIVEKVKNMESSFLSYCQETAIQHGQKAWRF